MDDIPTKRHAFARTHTRTHQLLMPWQVKTGLVAQLLFCQYCTMTSAETMPQEKGSPPTPKLSERYWHVMLPVVAQTERACGEWPV